MGNTAGKKRFQILNEKFGNQQLLKLYDSKTKEYVSILPEMGGMLLSMELLVGSKLVSVLDCYSSEKELKETLGNSFKGCNLFPFPNRIAGGKYEFEGKNHQLYVNFPNENNAIHGLIFDKPFAVSNSISTDHAALVGVKYVSDGKLTGYPYRFILEVEFTFEEDNGLTVNTLFTNTDSVNIPVGNGWHPYFQLQSKVDKLIFSFPAKLSFEVNDKMIPTGKTVDYSEFQIPKSINNTSFDTCFGLENKEGIAIITIEDHLLHGGIKIWQDTGKNKFNYLQIYTPPSRKTIAIEPMTCAPDALNNKLGLICLEPGKTISTSWGVNSL